MARTEEILVTLPGGRRVDAQVGEHTVHTDQPVTHGGEDSAPSPFDLFLASLGACAGIFVQGFCAQRSIPSRDIQLVERMQYSPDGTLAEVSIEVRVPPSFPEKYRAALENVVEQCSVKRAIRAQPGFKVHCVAAGEGDTAPASQLH